MNNKRYFVYTLIDPRNGQPFYVGAGSGKRENKRLKDHIGEAKNDPSKWTNPEKSQLVLDIINSGLKPSLIVTECVDETHCSLTERELIKQHGRICDGGILTNRGAGGEGIKGVRKGANKNGRLPPRPVYQFNLDGKLIKCFPAITQAADEVDVSHTAIVNACCGKYDTKTVAGFRWSYEDSPLPPLVKHDRTKRTMYHRFDLYGNYIDSFNSGKEVLEKVGVDPSTIIKYLNGKIRHAGGFQWVKEKAQ